MLGAAAAGVFYSLIQLPFAMYHAVKEKRLIRGKFLPTFDFYGDKVFPSKYVKLFYVTFILSLVMNSLWHVTKRSWVQTWETISGRNAR